MLRLSCPAEPVQNLAVLAKQSGQPKHVEQDDWKVLGYQPGKALQLWRNWRNKKEEKLVAGSQKLEGASGVS